jgi:hypothetical protein
MYVCHLRIEGFRGIGTADITFGQHTVLLGANNVGKSAIIDALGLVLGRDKLVRTLGDYDFFGGLPIWIDTSPFRFRTTLQTTDGPKKSGNGRPRFEPFGKLQSNYSSSRQCAHQLGSHIQLLSSMSFRTAKVNCWRWWAFSRRQALSSWQQTTFNISPATKYALLANGYKTRAQMFV